MSDLRAFLSAVRPVEATDDPVTRLAYSHDASPLALKSALGGSGYSVPGAVVFPADVAAVQHVVRAATATGVALVPFGAGSSIVGGALADHESVVVELKRLGGMRDFDPVSGLVTVGAGMNGQHLEDALAERGHTSGHYPQSLRSSTVGGWVAHRGIGTASTMYGAIEDLVAGLEVVLPSGELLQLFPRPRASTGPDLRQLFLGSEGAFGIVTSVTLRVRPVPEARRWVVLQFASFTEGLDFVRLFLRRGLRPAVVRLYDEAEAGAKFGLNGIAVLLLGCEGYAEETGWLANRLTLLGRGAGGHQGPGTVAEHWWATRLDTPGLLNSLRQAGGIADALEVSAPWSRLPAVYRAMGQAIVSSCAGLATDLVVQAHLSHAYIDGGNLYIIFSAIGRRGDLAHLYRKVVDMALTACAGAGGSLSHHHGIGSVRADLLALEIGDVGMGVLRSVRRALDPQMLFNPHKLTEGTLAGFGA
jgi:alkyldihydroxyacetonephosphate synthase